jgi:hypothetical protein
VGLLLQYQPGRNFSRRLRRNAFLRNFVRRFHHVFEELFEILQTGGRDDDGVAPPADVLGDAQEPAARIFLERENEGLALNLNLLALQGVFLNRRLGWL